MNKKQRAIALLFQSLRSIIFLASFLYLAIYLLIAILRLNYPFEHEWMEGGTFTHVLRIIAGQPIYVEPSIEFIPFIYTPFYYYIAAIFYKIFANGLMSLRLVSLLASIGCLGLAAAFVHKETKSIFWATVSLGVFTATYRIHGAMWDLARVDALFLFLLLAGIFLLRFYRRYSSHLCAGILLALAFFTKQSALFVVGAMVLCSLWIMPKNLKWHFPACVTVLILSGSLLLNYSSSGWFYYYIFALPQQHTIVQSQYIDFWLKDMLRLLPALTSAMLLFYYSLRQQKYSEFLFYFFFCLGMLGMSWSSRLHSGGYLNVLLPACAVLSILLPVGLHAAIKSMPLKGELAFKPTKWQWLALFICFAQLTILVYNPLKLIPKHADRQAGLDLVEKVKRLEGEVWMPFHTHIPLLAEKKTYAHAMAIADILRGSDREKIALAQKRIETAIRSGQFKNIIVDYKGWEFIGPVEDNYHLTEKLFLQDDVFWPVAGIPTRPEFIYVFNK